MKNSNIAEFYDLNPAIVHNIVLNNDLAYLVFDVFPWPRSLTTRVVVFYVKNNGSVSAVRIGCSRFVPSPPIFIDRTC